MIKIEKLNESYVRVLAEPGIFQELHDMFTFDVPGAKFTPKYKAKLWDGKIRLLDGIRKTLYAGLVEHVKRYASEQGMPVEFDSEAPEKISDATLTQFLEWLNVHDKDQKIEVRDYQENAIRHAINSDRTLLLSPTASGKSLIIYCLLRYHLEHKRKCLIIVPSTSLVEQLYSNFEDYSTKNEWKVSKHCQKLYSGFSKEVKSRVLITTWQSIFNMPAPWFKQFDVVFGDEAHLFKAASLTKVMTNLTQAKYRIGTTGTIDDAKVNKLVLEGHFGPIHKVISTKELMETNQVTNLKITCLVLKYSEQTRKTMKDATYQDEIKFIIGCKQRNTFIRNLTMSLEGNTLVLFQRVETHGKILYQDILNRVDSDRKVFLVYGKTETEDREIIRKLVDQESNAIIMASYGVFSTGINIPSIENVIFAHPSKSKIRNLQSIGRGLRLKNGKTECNLYDISDDLSWKKTRNNTLDHLAKRIMIYTEEKFNYKLVEVKIE